MNNLSSNKLHIKSMENIEGGCVTGGVNAAVTGFCTLGSFLNPFVAIGCGGYGVYQLFSCAQR